MVCRANMRCADVCGARCWTRSLCGASFRNRRSKPVFKRSAASCLASSRCIRNELCGCTALRDRRVARLDGVVRHAVRRQRETTRTCVGAGWVRCVRYSACTIVLYVIDRCRMIRRSLCSHSSCVASFYLFTTVALTHNCVGVFWHCIQLCMFTAEYVGAYTTPVCCQLGTPSKICFRSI